MLKVEKELLQEMESLGFKKVEGGTEWFHKIKTKTRKMHSEHSRDVCVQHLTVIKL